MNSVVWWDVDKTTLNFIGERVMIPEYADHLISSLFATRLYTDIVKCVQVSFMLLCMVLY